NSSWLKFSFLRSARTVGTRRARASCASLAGGASESESSARWRCSSLIASKARQSVFGGFFGLSLNLVIPLLFMRLRSSGGYDADHVALHRVGHVQHSAVDKTDCIETQFAGSIAVIEL